MSDVDVLGSLPQLNPILGPVGLFQPKINFGNYEPVSYLDMIDQSQGFATETVEHKHEKRSGTRVIWPSLFP
jgi:hypothetical protein